MSYRPSYQPSYQSGYSCNPNPQYNHSQYGQRFDSPISQFSESRGMPTQGFMPPLKVQLDEYNSDIYLEIEDDKLTAYDMHDKAFECLWAGVRGSSGIQTGKCAFEVEILDELVDGGDHIVPAVLRVGWSVDNSLLELGEDSGSFGFGGTGKAVVRKKFDPYGVTFGRGDIVTAYLDYDSGIPIISFSVNGCDFPPINSYNEDKIVGGRALFPHFFIKNIRFRANFGDQPPRFPLRPGFIMLADSHELVDGGKCGRGLPQDYEFLMMVGLPACGKSTWAEKLKRENPEKKYVILGTNVIFEKMKVTNLKRKRNYHGRFEALFQEANEVLKKLMEVAVRKYRNYILDQTNVFQSARFRKCKSFPGYTKRAVVIIQDPAELERRTLEVGQRDGKWVPVKAVMDMKKNFKLPDRSENWTEVIYPECSENDAAILVANYNSEANDFFSRGLHKLDENIITPPPKYVGAAEPESKKYKSDEQSERAARIKEAFKSQPPSTPANYMPAPQMDYGSRHPPPIDNYEIKSENKYSNINAPGQSSYSRPEREYSDSYKNQSYEQPQQRFEGSFHQQIDQRLPYIKSEYPDSGNSGGSYLSNYGNNQPQFHRAPNQPSYLRPVYPRPDNFTQGDYRAPYDSRPSYQQQGSQYPGSFNEPRDYNEHSYKESKPFENQLYRPSYERDPAYDRRPPFDPRSSYGSESHYRQPSHYDQRPNFEPRQSYLERGSYPPRPQYNQRPPYVARQMSPYGQRPPVRY